MNDTDRAIAQGSIDATDRVLKELTARQPEAFAKVTCRKGCFYCCAEALHVERREVEYMLESLTPEQIESVKERTKIWIQRTVPSGLLNESVESKERFATAYVKLQAYCPFLMKGLCSVYERRPIGCRMFMAIGPKELCEDFNRHDEQSFASFHPSVNSEALMHFVESGRMELNHLGVFLAEILLGIKIPTATHEIIEFKLNETT